MELFQIRSPKIGYILLASKFMSVIRQLAPRTLGISWVAGQLSTLQRCTGYWLASHYAKTKLQASVFSWFISDCVFDQRDYRQSTKCQSQAEWTCISAHIRVTVKQITTDINSVRLSFHVLVSVHLLYISCNFIAWTVSALPTPQHILL